MIGYKMFRVSKKHPGKLYPLFVLADQETKIGLWLPAQCGERTPDGKVKSRLGPLAFRPGWHLADLPLATHIGVMEDGKIKYQRPDLVWCLCEFSDRISYQEEADRNGMNDKGVLVPKKAYLQHIPVDGRYRYKTSPLMFRNWVMKYGRLLGQNRKRTKDGRNQSTKTTSIFTQPLSNVPSVESLCTVCLLGKREEERRMAASIRPTMHMPADPVSISME